VEFGKTGLVVGSVYADETRLMHGNSDRTGEIRALF